MTNYKSIGWISTIAYGLMMVVVPGWHGPQHRHQHNCCSSDTTVVHSHATPHCCHHTNSHPAPTAPPVDSQRDSQHPDDCPVCELLAQPIVPSCLVVYEVQADYVHIAWAVTPSLTSYDHASGPPARGPPLVG